METMEQKNERNARVAERYDELMREGKHGHYETMFRVVREEVERERERCAKVCEQTDDDGEGPDCWGWHAKDYAKAIRWA